MLFRLESVMITLHLLFLLLLISSEVEVKVPELIQLFGLKMYRLTLFKNKIWTKMVQDQEF